MESPMQEDSNHRCVPTSQLANNPEPPRYTDIDPWPESTLSAQTSITPLSPSSSSVKTFWITPHTNVSYPINVLDLSSSISMHHAHLKSPSKSFIQNMPREPFFWPTSTLPGYDDFAADPSLTPIWTWCGFNDYVSDPTAANTVLNADGEQVAEWVCPKHPLRFPPWSPHSSHPITIRRKHRFSRTEVFIANSQRYQWKMKSLWSGGKMTLYKLDSGSGRCKKKTVVGKFRRNE